MKVFRFLIALIMTLILTFTASMASAQTIIRVDKEFGSPSPTGFGNGWYSNAFKYLADAIAYAAFQGGSWEIWVRAGIYRPDESASPPSGGQAHRAATFQLRNNVSILGGFVTNAETNKNQRNPVANVTTLSGNLVSDGHSLHVVSVSATTIAPVAVALLDGFTITGGDADQSESGLFPFGGGVYITGPDSQSIQCAPTIVRCRIDGNHAREGAGVYMDVGQSSVPTFIACRFNGNIASSYGGGAFIRGEGNTLPGKPEFINSLFTGNVAQGQNVTTIGHGGAMYSDSHSAPRLLNCTFTLNSSTSQTPGAGGIYQESTCHPPPVEGVENDGPSIINSIIWNNGIELVGENKVYNSIVQDHGLGTGICEFGGPVNNSSLNPLFQNASSDFRLSSGSPAIDSGDNLWLQQDLDIHDINQNGNATEIVPDLALHLRIVGNYVASGAINCHLVDRGAYEYAAPNCVEDIAPQPGGDGGVGVQDLLAVITAWGACPAAPATCFADIAPIAAPFAPCTDHTVGVADLLAIISHWGPCVGPGEEGSTAGMPQTVQDCMNMCAPLGIGTPEYVNCVTKCTNALP